MRKDREEQKERGKKSIRKRIVKIVALSVLGVCLAIGLTFGAMSLYDYETHGGLVSGFDYQVACVENNEEVTESDRQKLYDFIAASYAETENYAGFRAAEGADGVALPDGENVTISVEETFYGFLLNNSVVRFRHLYPWDCEKIRNALPLFLQSAQKDAAAKKYASAIKKVYYTAYLDWYLSSSYFTGKTPLYAEELAEAYQKIDKTLQKKLNTLNDEEWIECTPLLCGTSRRIDDSYAGVPRYRYRTYRRRLKKVYKRIQNQPDSLQKVRFYLVNGGFYKKNCGDFIIETADIYEVLAEDPAGVRFSAGEGVSADIHSTFTYLNAFYLLDKNSRLFELTYNDRGLDVVGHCRAFAENLYKESGILFPAEPGGIPTLRSVYEGLFLYLR